MLRSVWALCLTTAFLSPGIAFADGKVRLADLLALEEGMQEVVKETEPAIACVIVTRSEEARNQDLTDPKTVPESWGSGVVLDEKGLILTSYHVVREATRVYVRLPGNKNSYADVWAADPRSDLAVLKVTDKQVLPLKAVKFGNGAAVKKGQLIVHMQNACAPGMKDSGPTASLGSVTNLRWRGFKEPATDDERIKSLYYLGILMQVETIHPGGCSGGAVFNLKGELIGLTTSLAAITGNDTPAGLATPMDDGIKRIIDVLRRGEEVEYGFLGVSYQRPGLGFPGARGEGVLLENVIPGSPAFNAGIKGGDSLLEVNDVPIKDPTDLLLQIGTQLAGTTAKLKVAVAGGGVKTFNVTLAKSFVQDSIIAAKRPDPIGGLRVDYASILVNRPGANRFFNRSIPTGVVIREVVKGSPADTARLQPDKVIRRVNGRLVNNPAEYYREMQNAVGPVKLTLVNSDGSEDEVKLETR